MYIENLLAIMSFVVCTTYLFIDQPDHPHNMSAVAVHGLDKGSRRLSKTIAVL